MEASASPTGRIDWDVITPKAWSSTQTKTRPKTLWKRRSGEKSQERLFHRAWKSRPERGIPTFPQRRRRLDEIQQPDISLATKSGHFNLLRTEIKRNVGYGASLAGLPHPCRAATEPALSEVERVGYADRGNQLSPNPRQSSPASRD